MSPLSACRNSTILAAIIFQLVSTSVNGWSVSIPRTGPPATNAKSAASKTLALIPALLNDAYAAAQTLETSQKGFAFYQIAGIQAQIGDIRGAKKTAEEITDAYLRSDTLQDIAKVQIESGDKLSARQTVRQAKAAAASISDVSRQYDPFHDIAMMQITQLKDKADAKETLLRAKRAAKACEPHFRSHAYYTIASLQAQAGDVFGARQTVRETADPYDKTLALSYIAVAPGQTGDMSEALKIAEDIDDDFRKAYAFRQMAIVQAQSGDLAGALQTATTIEDDFNKISALRSIADIQVSARDIVGVRKSLRQARQQAEAMQLSIFKPHFLCQIAESQNEVKDSTEARGTLLLAFAAANLLEKDAEKAFSLCNVAETQNELGYKFDAKETSRQAWFAVRTFKPRDAFPLLRRIAAAQAQAGEALLARRTATEISDANTKSLSLCDIGLAQLQEKSGKNDAKESLRQARQSANIISDSFDKLTTLCSIAAAQAKAGDTQGIEETFRTIKSGPFGASALCRIAQVQANAGYIQRAKETLRQAQQYLSAMQDELEGNFNKDSGFENISVILTQLDEVNEARAAANQISSLSSRVTALCKIAQAIVQESKPPIRDKAILKVK